MTLKQIHRACLIAYWDLLHWWFWRIRYSGAGRNFDLHYVLRQFYKRQLDRIFNRPRYSWEQMKEKPKTVTWYKYTNRR